MKMLPCFVKDPLLIKAMRIEKGWDVNKNNCEVCRETVVMAYVFRCPHIQCRMASVYAHVLYIKPRTQPSPQIHTQSYIAIPIWYTHVWIWGLKSSPQIPIQKLCLIQMHIKTLAIQPTIDAPVQYPGCLQSSPCVPWCFSGSYCLQWLPQILERNITIIPTYMSVFMCCQPITM